MVIFCHTWSVMLHTFPHSWIKKSSGKKKHNPNNAAAKITPLQARLFTSFWKSTPKTETISCAGRKNSTLRIIHPLNWFPAKNRLIMIWTWHVVCVCFIHLCQAVFCIYVSTEWMLSLWWLWPKPHCSPPHNPRIPFDA